MIGMVDKHAVRDLILFADNDGDLYRQSYTPIVANLKKKMAKGKFDAAKSVTLWKYHADRAAQKYTKEFGGRGPHGSYGTFSPDDRRAAAKHWAAEFINLTANGEI